MELSAIYHRPESEYAYLYKDKKLHIRIRTKKGDIESINLHYGDPFIFMEEFYQDTKEMVKITSGTLFDHWQVEVSVDFAHISISLSSEIQKVKIFCMAIKGVWKIL